VSEELPGKREERSRRHQEVTCQRKQAFLTRKAANNLANKLLIRDGRNTLVYQCPACGLWHLTHGSAGPRDAPGNTAAPGLPELPC
jgi:hypothetical protein